MRPRLRGAKVRSVLLDGSFLEALLDADSALHGPARAMYSTLVDGYEGGLDRLFAAATVLAEVPAEIRRSALAPVQTVYISRQHRTAIARTIASAEAGGASTLTPETALSLVLMQRERIRAVATASDAYDGIDVQVLSLLDHSGPRIRPSGEPTIAEAGARL